MTSAMARHTMGLQVIGRRPPSAEDVAALLEGLAHIDPVVGQLTGSDLELTVSVLAASDEAARGYVDRLMEPRTRDWIATWVYRTG